MPTKTINGIKYHKKPGSVRWTKVSTKKKKNQSSGMRYSKEEQAKMRRSKVRKARRRVGKPSLNIHGKD